MERQVIKLVEQLVPKFRALETQLTTKSTLDLISYYQEFTQDSRALPLLTYISKHGDSNLAMFNARK